MDGCYFASYVGQVFGWTQMLPVLITLTLTVLGIISHQFIWAVYGGFLYITQLLLWILQLYYKQMRPDPICQLYHSYAYPSMSGYYSASLVTFAVAYAYYWNVVQPWFVWLILYLLAAVPPIVVVFLSYNGIWEVVFSMAFGVVFTTLFVISLKLYISPTLPYILSEFPCSTLGYVDTYLMCASDLKKYTKCKDVIKSIDAARLSNNHGSLWVFYS